MFTIMFRDILQLEELMRRDLSRWLERVVFAYLSYAGMEVIV